MLASTDCCMSPVTFELRSTAEGKYAYAEAEVIAQRITEYLKDPRHYR